MGDDDASDVTQEDLPRPAALADRGAQLVVVSGGPVGRRTPIDQKVVLGRGSDVEVLIDDAGASRQHARVCVDGGVYQIEDLNSRNGTLVNGAPVVQRPLAFGDRIQIGGWVLLFTHTDPVEDDVLQRERLEAIGRLGTGIAHDLNNLLSAVLASVDYVTGLPKGRTLADDDVAESLDDVRIAAARASELTRRLLGFAQRGPRRTQGVDVGALAREVTHLLRRALGRNIRLEPNIVDGLVTLGDRSQLHQMLMNLCINARDAMPDGGTLTVTARIASSAELQPLPLRDRPHVVVEVRDTGTGMSDEVRARVFEPFFTTKEGKRGSGLGLSTVHEVAVSHGGHIEVESHLGEGSCFRVYLPRSQRRPDWATPDTLERRSFREPKAGLRILLVDDEDVVRRSCARLLRIDGHHVVEAANGVEAIARWHEAQGAYDLVLLDVDMPELGGPATARKLLELSEDARIVFVSGYWEEQAALEGIASRGFLRKPFGAPELRQLLAQAMDDRESRSSPDIRVD